jgi:tRNA A-37 threonylcarbamoyl transferase component Bud32
MKQKETLELKYPLYLNKKNVDNFSTSPKPDEPVEQLKFVDICRIIKEIYPSDIISDEDLVEKYYKSMFPVAMKLPSSDNRVSQYGRLFLPKAQKIIMFTMNSGKDLFLYNPKVDKHGVSGLVMESSFGSGENSMQRSVVKLNKRNSTNLRTDIMEIFMQAMLFCEMRTIQFSNFMKDHGSHYARIPKILFGARFKTSTDRSNYIGMEALDVTLHDFLLDLHDTPNQQLMAFVSIMIAICTTLEYLQSEFKFVHGDMHTGNIMMKGSRPYIIDFGRANGIISGKYYSVDDKYEFEPTKSLDLIILLTHLHIEKHSPEIMNVCKKLVYEPFWDNILSEDPRIVARLTEEQMHVRKNYQTFKYHWTWHSLIHELYSESVKGITPSEIREQLQKM